MNDQDVFRSKDEELQRLTQEIAGLKSSMKEIALSLSRIERHVKRSFGIPPKTTKTQAKDKSGRKATQQKREDPTIKPEEALKLFDEFSEDWDADNPALVKNKLQEMALPNLKLMAHELGVTFKSKPSKKKLCEGIMGRLNERAMLSRNVNVTSPLKDNGIEKI